MTKTGRNDPCHCGALKPDGNPVKYKNHCLKKDERKAELQRRVRSFSRKDLISGPYKDCPKCGKPTFGVFMHTGGKQYGRECTTCWHTQGFSFPEIRKKVIYLDQFLISNMAKAIDPDAHSHATVTEQPFWLEAYKRLDTLSQLNLAIYPDSTFHRDESLLTGDAHYESLKTVYEHLSHGCTFYDHDTITRFQVQQHLKNYLEGIPEKPLELITENVVHGHLHEWNGRMRVGVNMRPYPGQLEAIQKERDGQYEGLKSVFERWQKEKDKDFMDWVREEAYAFGEGTVKAHLAYLKKRAELPQKYAEQYLAGKEPDISLEDLFPPPSSQIIEDMTRELRVSGLQGEEALKKMIEYLRSKHIIDIPTVHISSLLFGAVARKAASGQKAPPNRGTVTDVNAIASLLPYCDAIFIDNGMAALLAERPLKKEMEKYGTKIFCPNTKEEFLAYLEEVRASATSDHMRIVEDAYGENHTEPYVSLLINKRETDALEKDFDDKA